MKIYKLTNKDSETLNNQKWELNTTVSLPKKDNPKLCSSDVLHGYKSIDLALLLNTVHGNVSPFLIYECEGKPCVATWEKIGSFALTPKKLIPTPDWYENESIRKEVTVLFAVLCAESVLYIFEKEFPKDNRPRKAIEAAKNYFRNPIIREVTKSAEAAVKAVARSTWEAWSAAKSAEAAVKSAEADRAAEILVWSATAASLAVRSAWAAEPAWLTWLVNKELDVDRLADQAVRGVMEKLVINNI